MTQELTDLKTSILQGRYEDALALVDELEGMSRKAILRTIKSFLTRMLIHLIKNQIEQRMNNSWAASIRDSLLEIQELNLQDNQTAHYVKQEDWNAMLRDCLKRAIANASVEVEGGAYSPFQLVRMVNEAEIIQIATELLDLTYLHESIALLDLVNEYLSQLPGGDDWKFSRS